MKRNSFVITYPVIVLLLWVAMVSPPPLSTAEVPEGTPAKLDILFILDGTQSIRQHTASIERIFENINTHLKQEQLLGSEAVWAGVFIYRDHPVDCADIDEFETVFPLQAIPSTGLDLINSSLFKSCDRDPLESVYHGLHLGIANSRTRPHSRKVLIHIGDAGDHGGHETLNQLQTTLAEKKIHYYALNLNQSVDFRKSTHPLVDTLSKECSSGYYENIERFSQDIPTILHLPTPTPPPKKNQGKKLENLAQKVQTIVETQSNSLFHQIIGILGLESTVAYLAQRPFLETVTLVLLIIILMLLVYSLSKKVIVAALNLLAGQVLPKWGAALKARGVFNMLNFFFPGVVLYLGLGAFPAIVGLSRRVLEGVFILLLTLAISRLTASFTLVYEQWEIAKKHPIRAYIQLLNILIYALGIILILSHLINRSPLILLSGIGALAAIFMFVFKNTVLSFAANIQISNTRMIQVGDDIKIPQFGANGKVMEIGLNAIKVKNTDNSIVFVPPYKLLEGSFQNLKEQKDTGRKKLIHSFFISPSSVNFCTKDQLEKIKKINDMDTWVNPKSKEQSTNLGLFRRYMENYLGNHSSICQETPVSVQVLELTAEGVPLLVKAVSKELSHSNFLKIKAEIVEHIMAMAHEFNLNLNIDINT